MLASALVGEQTIGKTTHAYQKTIKGHPVAMTGKIETFRAKLRESRYSNLIGQISALPREKSEKCSALPLD